MADGDAASSDPIRPGEEASFRPTPSMASEAFEEDPFGGRIAGRAEGDTRPRIDESRYRATGGAMGREIERKFLVVEPPADFAGDGVRYVQGYLVTDPERTVRVRTAGERGFLTIKGPTAGATRAEFEYEIPLADALELLETLCERPLIEKRRHRVVHAGRTWEIDVFDGANAGLVVAEIELEREDEQVDLPRWVGTEVTHDPRYLNVNLVRRPFRTW